MLNRVLLVLAMLAGLGGGALAQGSSAVAQEASVPDRRVVTSTGQDFYGGDIGSIFDTTFKACRKVCLGNPECKALTYNTRAKACFLKSGVERREPFPDAISAELVETASATRDLARVRRAELGFLEQEHINSARTLAETLGTRVAANGLDAASLRAGALVAEQGGRLEAAAQGYAAAVTVADSGDDWRALARVWLASTGANTSETRQFRADALSAATNAYLRSDTDGARASSLFILASALEANGAGRAMIEALRASQILAPRPETDQRLAYAISRYGFRVTGHQVDSEAADARICVEFSEPLAEAGVDYAPFVRADRDPPLPVSVEGQQLCLDGVIRGERYKVTLRAGLPAGDAETLPASVTIEAYVRDRSPSVRFAGRGHVLPQSANAAIPVVTVNLSEVEIAIHRISERNLLPAIQDNIFDQALNKWREDQIAGRRGVAVWTGTAEVSGPVNADVTTALPLGEAVQTFRPGVYAMTARVPGDTDDWDRAATQWFIVTDLGLATMAGVDGLHAFVRALSSADPVPGAKVALLARNNEVLGTETADADGYVRFDPGLTRGQGGAAPALLTVSQGEDFAFLDLAGPAFDLSDRGVEGRAAAGPVDVFATTERGVYRPGEVVHLTALARDGRAGAIADLPLTLVILRPDGVEYHRAVLADQGAGGRSHAVRLGSGAPRGRWTARIHTDPERPSVRDLAFLVEDIVPERIDVTLDAPEGPVPADAGLSIDLQARYLYGAPGAGLVAEGEVRVTAADAVPGFPGFRFGLETETVGSLSAHGSAVTTDASGAARLEFALPDTGALTRSLQATAIVTVRDSSGRPVERRLTRPVAPTGPQIGIRPLFDGQAPEGGLARFEVVAIGPDSAQIPLERVGWTLSKVNRRWQWYAVNGRWNYEPITSKERVANGTIALTADGRTTIEAAVDWGQYELKLADLSGAPAAASLGFNAGWYTVTSSADTPDVLEIGLDKARYALGETVRVRLKPRHAGKVLLSVVDNRLIETRVLDVAGGETSADLTVTEDWGPGAYVTAMLIRPGDAEAGRNPARSLGLAWAGIEPGARALDVTVTTPDEVAPRGPLSAGVRIAGLAPGTRAYVTLAAVDVGILNLTGFKSPSPEAHYFAQRALGVEMRDLYGRLIDGHQGVRGRLRSGGDAAQARLQSPPPTEALVAYFSGVLTVGPDGTATAPFELPDFNGTVRVMAVAWTADAVGHAAKDVLVRDPVVVSAALPRFLAPGDRAVLGLTFAHAKGSAGDMAVTLAGLTGGLAFEQDIASQQVTLGAGESREISIPLEATEIGDQRLEVRTRTPDGTELTKTLTVPVRLLDPEISRQSRIALATGARFTVDRQAFTGLETGSARATLAFGPLAAFDAPGLLSALDRYPYGCTEQTTSRALPLLYLGALAEALGVAPAADLDARIDGAIASVLENQSSAGSFGLWQPDRGDLWLDAYVTDFLSRARAEGRAVPDLAFGAALDNLLSAVGYAGDFDLGGEDIAYALMVLAREGRASIGDLRYYADVKGENFATPMAKAQLGAALAFYGEQARADAMFRLAEAQALTPSEGTGWRADYGSDLRDGAAVLALAAEARSEVIDRRRLTRTIAARGAGRTSTQEKVWMLLASAAALEDGASGLLIDGVPIGSAASRLIRPAAVSASPLVIENTGPATDLVLTTIGVSSAPEPAGGKGYRLERAYYTLDGDPVSPAQVARNTRLAVVLTVHSDQDRTGRLMIDDPLPAGFEIDNPNLLQSGAIGALAWLQTSDDVQSAEFRTERFLAAVDHAGKGSFQLAYLVRAVSPGRFHHPAALVEDMYRPAFRAWTDSGTITVVGAR